MPKTIILAIATLILAVAALVTDIVSPYAGAADPALTAPMQVQMPSPARVPVRVEVRALASKTANSTPIFDAI